MPSRPLQFHVAWSALVLASALRGADDAAPAKPEEKPAPTARSVEQIAKAARPSVVVITFSGRDGKRQGLGTGFVVGADGLIATNLHVIGEARPVAVELADGKRCDVTSVHASDRSLDLALIRVNAKNLPPLELADSDQVKDGQPVVALGNPLGLKHSVVSGVVSARREVEGRSMLQLAIPLEPGNSGGPLLDMQGRVVGVLTLKSLVTDNLGFAVSSNALKPLLKKPNPIAMSRWLTIGALDAEEWTPRFEARWRQRAGRIQVEGAGSGFGGRSLCLYRPAVPDLPYEIAVAVKLDDEAGAAGLVFQADGGDKHYGFYPSSGQLRLTRFDGPDVYSWKILRQEKTPHYQPGEWNTLKVRLEKDKIKCYVNDLLAFEEAATDLSGGQAGLAKFRDTRAEFKNFRMARQITARKLAPDLLQRIGKSIEGLSPRESPRPEAVQSLLPDAAASVAALRERAKLLEQQATQLRQLAVMVHQQRVQADLDKVLTGKEDDIDLLHAALLIARLDNDELDVAAYRTQVERMARDIMATLPKEAADQAKMAALNKFLFQERGFHGSRGDYYNRSNSYLNEVLDDREGIPITLSVLYLELSRRLGLKVVGVGLPGHFVVKHIPAKGEAQLIDVYEAGQPLAREEAGRRVLAITGKPLQEEQLAAVPKRAIIVRMLHNLMGVAGGEKDLVAVLRYLDTILAVAPDAAEERMQRALLRFQNGQKQGALEDTDWLLQHQPEGLNAQRVLEFRRLLTRPER